MPHSPYTKQVHPPISDNELETFSDSLQRIRYEQEQGRYDEYAVDTPLNIGEALIEHCEFLEAKLKIKKRENVQLATQSEALEKKVAALEKENGVLTDENKAYKQELTTLKAKLEMEKELLKDEKEACKKEFSTLKATLEEKLVAQGKEEAGGIDNQAKQGVKHEGKKNQGGADAGGDAKRPAEAGPSQDESLEVESSQLAATSTRKRELEPDPDAEQNQPPKKGKQVRAKLEGRE